MAILNNEDFFARLKAHIGEDTSDEALSLMEDFTDTYNDLESRANGDSSAEWKQKYEDNDAMWRKKYKERFFSGGTTPEDVKEEQNEDVRDDSKTVSFNDLFEEREG